MNEQFNRYLVIIGLVIAVILSIPVIFLVRAGKRRRKSNITPVDGGSAGALFDASGNVVILPYVKDRFGGGRATSEVEFLRVPYKPKKLGEVLRRALRNCRGAVPCETKELLELLGAKDWTLFAQGRRNVSVHFKEGAGIVFHSTRNKGEGVFEFSGKGTERVLKPDADDEQLGAALLEMLKRCR